MAGSDGTAGSVLCVLSVLAILCNGVSVVCKLCQQYINPKLWKYSLFYQNIAHIWTSVGLGLYWVNIKVPRVALCNAAGFFLLYGLVQSALSFLNTGIILLSIQNPGKSDSISHYHRNIFLVVVIPEVVFGAVLCILPYVSDSVVSSSVVFDVDCLPIVDHGKSGAAYGTLVLAILWIILSITVVCDILIILKLWKFNNRIDLSPNNVWQSQLVWHGKRLAVISSIEHLLYVYVCVITTASIYSESSALTNHKTWVVLTSVAVATMLHGILSNVSDVMWGTCCCRAKNAVQEPHRKLKKLELVKIEAPGKLRMKALWSVGKHANKRGLMKIYGVSHLKSWAQEIVMLGMMRKAQHPSLIQCLWTNSSNPYYETMTLISGEIVTSDSRIICLEMTNGGTLQDFLQKAELPLPEPCQRMIIHDIAEGLFYLHHENILHNNLNSSCIYLKGSLQSMVLRAAVGDFEDAELYGTLQQSLDDSLRDKRYFFLPDIRSFALVALEIVSKMCVKKFQNRYINYNSDQVPLKINLENMISDEEDEFEEQYCYEIEDTHRQFECIHSDSDDDGDNGLKIGLRNQGKRNSLDNLLEKDRPLSPNYTGISRREAGLNNRPYCVEISGDEEDEEVMNFNTTSINNTKHMSYSSSSSSSNEPVELNRCKSPDIPKSQIGKVSSRKSRKDMSKSAEQVLNNNRIKSPQSRSLSPKALEQRCTSPDPMMDEKLQELRKETKTGKKSNKERKFSFNRKRSEENVLQKNGHAFEAFVTNADKNSKKKDGNWLSKPTSILKTIAGNESSVSVFKAKSFDEDSHLDAIEEEEIGTKKNKGSRVKVSKTKEKKEKPINEVWDIIDEQYYTQVNRKAMNKLKKTISGESRSSLWSFISTPEDLDDDDLDDILDSLPGMTDNFDLNNGKITIHDILAEKDHFTRKEEGKKRFSYKDLSKTRFELIDYYELLKSRKIQIEDVPEDKREMLLNVVELKLEEKLKREGKTRTTMDAIIEDGGAIRSDEMYDNGMTPEGSGLNGFGSPGNKSKIVSFRQNTSHVFSSPQREIHETEKDPRQDRSRSAPLKRARTPIQKTKTEMREKQLEQNPVFTDSKISVSGAAKRTRARSALKRALNNKGAQTLFRNDRERTPTSEKQDLTLKYATVKKINVKNVANTTEEIDVVNGEELISVPVPTSESFSVTKVKQSPKYIDSRVKRYPSFSSNESGSSIVSSVRTPKPADVSLTSGEVSSLSSQAESDHYETDGHLTDIEGPSSMANMRRYKSRPGPPSRVDSGIDSGSVSSEMSDAMYNRSKQNSIGSQNASKGALNSWARNYKTVDSIPASPYSFSNKFLPPFNSLPEESASTEGTSALPKRAESKIYNDQVDGDTDSALSVSTSNVSSSRMIEVTESRNRGTLNLLSRPMSPEMTTDKYNKKNKDKLKKKYTGRPMSPLNNPVRPSDRPMSPTGRPMSPKVRPTQVQRTKSTSKREQNNERPMSPEGRPMSPFNKSIYNAKARTLSPDSRPMSPNNKTVVQRTCASRSDISPSRALSPIERVDNHTKLQQQSRSYQSSQVTSGKNHSAPIINVESSDMNNNGGGQEKTNQASRRYRELVKQGVPLRASVVEASPTRQAENDGRDGSVSRPGTADSTLEEPMDDQQLFEDLQSKGFFATRGRSPKRQGGSPSRSISSQSNQNDSASNKSDTLKKKKRKKLALEELVRENPSSGVTAHRSPSKNHLIVSEDAFLNQPTSEDSETCSIKTNKSTNSSPSGSKPKVVVDAELVIDRIFSQNHPQDYDIDVEVEAALGLDKNPLKQIKKMYKQTDGPSNDVPNLDNIPLLNGVSQRHIHECLELASSLQVIAVRDLLPATKEGYDILSNKLLQIGQLGSVGTQLLDIIEKCWLLDMPPTSGTLVEQLTDPVTETEL